MKIYTYKEIYIYINKDKYTNYIYKENTSINIYIYTYVCMCMYVCMSVCLSVCLSVCMYVCMYVSMYLCIYVSMSLCLYVSMSLCLYVSMYVCMYVCMYVIFPFRFSRDMLGNSTPSLPKRTYSPRKGVWRLLPIFGVPPLLKGENNS